MRTRRGLGEVAVGIGFLVAGVLFLLSTLDIIPNVDWWRWLPALIIAWGVFQFVNARGQDFFGPLFLILLGTLLLLATTQVIAWGTFGRLWPVALILIGLSILMSRRRAGQLAVGASPGDTVDVVAVLGESARTLTSQSFRGGGVTALMGSAKLDLRDAKLADGATLNVTVIMAGIELRVPDEWEVDLSATAIMGGSDDQRRNRRLAEGPAPRLRITGFVLMGGLEVKS